MPPSCAHSAGEAADGPVRLVEPECARCLSGIAPRFEALILLLAPPMSLAAVARFVGESAHRVLQVCNRYVELGLEQVDFGDVKALAIDETSQARGHDYVRLAADALRRAVPLVTEGREAKAIKALAADLQANGRASEQIESVSIDVSPGFIKGIGTELPEARAAFDKFHVVAHANLAVDRTRRIEQRGDPSLEGLRCTLPKDALSAGPEPAPSSTT
jgi:transposase